MNRFAAPLLFAAIVVLSPWLSQDAFACSCGAIDTATALKSATVVFSGRVVAADRTMGRFQVDKMWKGQETSEIVMLTGTKVYPDGRMTSTSCDYFYALGQQYLVYARATSEGFTTSICARTAPLQEAEVRGLDRLVPHKRIAIEEQPCAVGGGTTGEIRILAINSGGGAIRSVRTILERTGGNFSATTDDAGRTAYRNLSAGDYTITAESDGYAPRRHKLQLAANGCMVTSIVLLPR